MKPQLAADPVYDWLARFREGPRGSGFQTVGGFKRRTPVDGDAGGARRLVDEVGWLEPRRAAGRHLQPVQPAAARSATTRTRT